MKIARTLLLAPFCCAAAFGLHGPKTGRSLTKNVFTGVKPQPPMVQALDLQGRPVSTVVSSAMLRVWA